MDTLFLSACVGVINDAALGATLLWAQAESSGATKPSSLDRPFIVQILDNPFVLPIALVAIFYITFLGPERRRKAEEARMLSSLKKNDRVVTRGGIHATVVSAGADSNVITVKIDEAGNTRVKVERSAIVSVVSASTPKDSSDSSN